MENDKKMADYIYSILSSQPTILMSWGFQRPAIIHLGLTFHVNGFKHKGKVSIKYKEGQDLFNVYLMDENGKIVDTIHMVYFDQLVELIDERVEKTDDYNNRVDNEYFK
ncbi:MAG: hypothetical protein WCH34_18130 [Bacteroidota bacterium]